MRWVSTRWCQDFWKEFSMRDHLNRGTLKHGMCQRWHRTSSQGVRMILYHSQISRTRQWCSWHWPDRLVRLTFPTWTWGSGNISPREFHSNQPSWQNNPGSPSLWLSSSSLPLRQTHYCAQWRHCEHMRVGLRNSEGKKGQTLSSSPPSDHIMWPRAPP